MYTQEATHIQAEQDKQVTVAVPEDRLAEFYAFFGRFLAVGRSGGRRGPYGHGGPGRHPRHGGHRCEGHRPADAQTAATTESAAPDPAAEPEA